MSNHWLNIVFERSPYKGADRLVHIVLADQANSEGESWHGQEKIAAAAGVSVRSVERAIKRMCDEGWLMKYRRGYQHRYRLLVSNGNPTSATDLPATRGGSDPTPMAGAYRTISESPEEPKPPAPPGPAKEKPVRASYGEGEELPEHGAKPKKVPFDRAPSEGTHGWLVQRFEQERQRTNVGTHRYNRGHLNRLLKSLRDDDGMSNKEIEVLVRTFFVRHGQTIRAKAREIDLVSLFAQMVPQLQQQAKDGIENVRTGRESASDRGAAESASILDRMRGIK